MALVDVETVLEVGVLGHGQGVALVGDREGEREGRVVECERRGAGHRAGHVGDAVVHDVVDDVRGIGVCGGTRGLGASALVDRDVDDDRAGLHLLHHVGGDEFRSARSGDQYGPDDEVGVHDLLLDGVVGRVDGLQHRPELLVQLGQAVQVLVDHGDPGFEAHGHPGGVGTDDTAADHDDLRRGDPRDTAEQLTAATLVHLEAVGTRLDGHASGDLGHRGQQGQAPEVVRDGLVGDRHALAVDEALRLDGVGRKMQVGEEDLILAQHRRLDRLGLLDLHDHLGALEDLLRGVDDLRAGRFVHVVVESDGGRGVALHHHLMAVGDEFPHGGRREPDPVLVDLDLLGHPDEHVNSLLRWLGATWKHTLRPDSSTDSVSDATAVPRIP